MIHLKLRTEYSFRRAYGKLPAVLDAAGGTAAAMTDNGTWGFVQFSKECKRRGVAPIYGWEVVVVDNPTDKARQPQGTVVLLAKNEVGLEALYNLSTWAGKHGFYYYPRIGYQQLATLDPNVILLVGPGCFIPKIHPGPNRYLQLSPESPMWNHAALGSGWPCVPVADNYFPTPPDRVAYEVLAADNKNDRSSPMHILGEWELRAVIPGLTEEHFANTHMIAAQCKAVLPHAEIVKPYRPDTLHGMCMEGAVKRGIAFRSAEGIEWMQVDGAVYTARLKRELDLIHEKQFEDYFYLIADVVQYAKEHMLVGPARGSSAGSLACYLLAITDVDPIVHDLMFERFIDVTRADLPDIDIDFQDTKRELVIAYLQRTYGEARVGRIGTVMRYKAKSTLTDVAKQLNIPDYEIKDVKDAVIERSTGDARAQFCILDALDSLEVGKALVAKYPAIRVSSELEGHARQSGMHAAGIIVCEEPITRYATIDRSGAAQIDKKDAEVLNLLKIDALGLRTLSVLQDALDQIGKTRDWLVTYPLTDEDAFDIFNQDRYSGIFQYEGYALQSLTRQMKIRNFDDIVIITALARPGPLHCGAATEFIARRIGRDPVTHLHPLVADITAPTYGTVIYQEQVMAIGRKMGNLSWEDVSELRKAMSKSLGEEFFNTYWEKFKVGAMAQGIDEYTARSVWDRMCTFGSWAFNKCIAAGTMVRMGATGGSVPEWVAIEDLYHKYVANPTGWTRGRMPVLQSLYPDGRVRPQAALHIVKNGRKLCWRYTLSDGTILECTPDHRFFINNAWQPISAARIGDTLTASHYEMAPARGRRSAARGRRYGRVQSGFPTGVDNPSYLNGKTRAEDAFIAGHRGQPCHCCHKVHARMEAHHLDGAHGAVRPLAMEWLCAGCHKRTEYAAGRTRRWGKGHATRHVTLVKREALGMRDTYDIEMPAHHNFVINGGVITHNSHAVSYGMISYWCAVFKAHYPLEYAAACLRNVKDQDQGIQLLRELVMEGFTYKPVDPQKSGLTWAVVEGELVGGLTNVKGIGQKTALDILERRMVGKPLTPSMAKKLIAPTTPYDDIFEGTRRFADVYLNPPAHKVTSGPVAYIKEVQDAGDYVVLAKLKEKNLRDLNEYGNVVKRGGRLVAQHNLFLNMVIEDDTGSIIVRVGRYQYAQWGKPLVESAKIGDWFLWRGRINGDGWRLLYIEKWRKMETFALADRHMAVNADLLKRIAGTTLTLAEVTTDEVD